MDAGPMVVGLLMTCPSLTVLVISGAPLRVSGERVHMVSPLTRPGAPDAIEQSEAIRLFADRAVAVVPSFELTPDSAETINELCRRSDGLPLVIELAATRLTLFTPAGLLRCMDARLALLRDGAMDPPDRLRSLHSSLAWSLDLLNASAQALFAGEWTLKTAEAVAGGGEHDPGGQEGLGSLIGLNLVWRKLQPDGTPRHGRLEMLREFAEEQLASQREDASDRYRHARSIRPPVRGMRSDGSNLSQISEIGPLEQEHANIRAALRWLNATYTAEALADLVSALGHHWYWGGREVEGLGWYQRVLGVRDLSPGVQLEFLTRRRRVGTGHARPPIQGEITDTLERASHDRTTISITHRLSMAVPADHIFVLADARVVEEETHATLYAAHSLHRCLYDEHTVTVATDYQ